MRNVIRAQNYQAKNDIVIIATLLIFGILTVISPLFNEIPFSEWTGSIYAVNSDKTILLYIVLIITTRVCGWDQSDKTINYELLAGHSRLSVFLGRIITSFIWAGVPCIVLMFVPLAVFSLINDWGYSVDLSWVIIRYLLAVLPILRVICELALLAFVIRNGGLSTILGFVFIGIIVILTMVIETVADKEMTWQLGVSNLMTLSGFSDYSFGYINGEDVMIYNSSLEPSVIAGTIAASVFMGGVSLLIGGVIFKKTDIK